MQLGLKSAGLSSNGSLAAYRTVAPTRSPASSLVSILFLSDGHQTRGVLQPLQGAARAKAAGIPVYTVALGTKGGKITNFPNYGGGGGFNIQGAGGGGPGGGLFGLQPDPTTLRAIARLTGGEFFRANSAGAVQAAYQKLGSSIGRQPGHLEVTDEFLLGAAVLLVLAGVMSAAWSPKTALGRSEHRASEPEANAAAGALDGGGLMRPGMAAGHHRPDGIARR